MASTLPKKKTKKKKKNATTNEATTNETIANAASTKIKHAGAPLLPPQLRCARCKGPVDPSKAQLIGKCAGSWRCNTCNTRGVQLSRLPEWKGFRNKLGDFSDDKKTEFRASTHDASSPQELKTLIDESMVTRTIEKEKSESLGGYYPLGYYKMLGYNTRLIRKNCQGTKRHPVLGRCYKVSIEVVSSGSESQKVHEKKYSKIQDGPNSNSAGSAGENPGEAANGGSPKPVVDEKARLKQKGVAQRVLAKIGVISSPFSLSMKHKAVAKLPTISVDGAKNVLSELVAMQKAAEKCINGNVGFSYTMADANELVARPMCGLLLVVIIIDTHRL